MSTELKQLFNVCLSVCMQRWGKIIDRFLQNCQHTYQLVHRIVALGGFLNNFLIHPFIGKKPLKNYVLQLSKFPRKQAPYISIL